MKSTKALKEYIQERKEFFLEGSDLDSELSPSYIFINLNRELTPFEEDYDRKRLNKRLQEFREQYFFGDNTVILHDLNGHFGNDRQDLRIYNIRGIKTPMPRKQILMILDINATLKQMQENISPVRVKSEGIDQLIEEERKRIEQSKSDKTLRLLKLSPLSGKGKTADYLLPESDWLTTTYEAVKQPTIFAPLETFEPEVLLGKYQILTIYTPGQKEAIRRIIEKLDTKEMGWMKLSINPLQIYASDVKDTSKTKKRWLA